jgi:hypothetical protein
MRLELRSIGGGAPPRRALSNDKDAELKDESGGTNPKDAIGRHVNGYMTGRFESNGEAAQKLSCERVHQGDFQRRNERIAGTSVFSESTCRHWFSRRWRGFLTIVDTVPGAAPG